MAKNYLVEDEMNGIYIKSETTEILGMHIASPSANGNDYITTASRVALGDWAGSQADRYNYGLRPIVCLKPDVQLEKQADGSYKIL